MNTNISLVVEGKNTFRCDVCGKSFANKTRLAKHIGAVHEGKNHLNVTFVTIALPKRLT